MFGSCLTSRLVLGALGGYAVASLTHSPTWSWLGAAFGALAVFLWSRRGRTGTARWCGTGCTVPERAAKRTAVDTGSGEHRPADVASPIRAGRARAGRRPLSGGRDRPQAEDPAD